ncbi:hypothetical protein PV402_39865 [Streptomyces scabiei]|uniref:hypothetical protein n=1 Tax=Streptomyces scabiei TaxID=1930 RepID=UPI0029B40DB5|nr:hypothetical protein [Streptomyces scabiei]MDX2658345.1 hypothetical protein [Streptomyces scabiei]MDX2870501.1 hypothetical protein [Streptomyces scabiei]
MAKFKFDDRALKKAVNQGVQKLADDLTKALNGLTPQYEGKSLEEIKPEIQRVWSKQTGGGSITDPELTTFAEQIQAGGRISVRMK